MMLHRACAVLAACTPFVSAYFDGYQTVKDPYRALQVRVAYNGPFSMMVSWNTFKPEKKPSVRFGRARNNLDRIAQSTVSVTYPTSLTYNNHVPLARLLPNTVYYYLPIDSHSKVPYSFKTPRLAGNQTPYNVSVVVDMGTFGPLGLSDHVGTGAANPLQPGEQTTIQAISKQLNTVDFIAHAGDIAYADYWLKEEIQGYLPNTTTQEGAMVYEHILNAFYDELMNITSVKPYMVSPGNHEANCDNGGTTDKSTGTVYTESICMPGQTNFTGYRNHWRMPSSPSGGVENFWYSYDNGMAHYISIDTETDLGHGLKGPDEGSPEFGGPFGRMNAQLDFLEKDLATVDRSKTPWVIVFGHRPFYGSTDGVCPNCTAAFEPLFHKYNVDLYIAGHSHLYEREAPLYQNKTDPKGLNNPRSTWYIINGAAGPYDGLDTLDSPLQPYSRYAQDTMYAWSKLLFHNCTHLTHQGIASKTNEVFDEATLVKDRTCKGS